VLGDSEVTQKRRLVKQKLIVIVVLLANSSWGHWWWWTRRMHLVTVTGALLQASMGQKYNMSVEWYIFCLCVFW